MSGPRWLASPLAGTACVLAGLGLLAIPLRKLTSALPPPPPGQTAPTVAAPTAIPAVLRLRLLAPAQRIVVTTAAGELLLDRRDEPTGESEHDALIPVTGGELVLTLQADFAAAVATTAVFLTVMPDGYEDQTRYVLGSGRIEEPLRYEWHTP